MRICIVLDFYYYSMLAIEIGILQLFATNDKKTRWRRQKPEKQSSHFFVNSLFYFVVCFHQFCCFAWIIIISLPLKKINNNELRMSTYIIQKKRTKFNSQNMNEWILYVLVVRTLAYKSFSGSNFFFVPSFIFYSFFSKIVLYTRLSCLLPLTPTIDYTTNIKKNFISNNFFFLYSNTRQENSKRILMMAHLIALTHTHTQFQLPSPSI